jgi:hypothetical protein
MQSRPPPSSSSRRIDEKWLQQWIAFGMLDMAIYLTKQAKFAAYLAKHDQPAKRVRVRRDPEPPSITHLRIRRQSGAW